MESNITFVYDGKCPFCNHFAELLELKSKLNYVSIVDGRKNTETIKRLLKKGYDLDKGAILIYQNKILHGSKAINFISKKINNPSDTLLRLITLIFRSKKRSELLFPFLIIARRLTLISRGVSTSIV